MYKKFSLKQQIILPFLGVFLSLWSLGIWAVGYWSTKNLEQTQKKATSELAFVILREFEKEETFLRLSAQLLGQSPDLGAGVQNASQNLLMKNLLPTRASLDLDIIQVINSQGEILVDLRSESLISASLEAETVQAQVLNGVYLSSILNAEENNQSLLIGASPIITRQGVIGGIIVGTIMNDNLLEQLEAENDSNILIAFNQGKIIATTNEEVKQSSWQKPKPGQDPDRVEIDSQAYLGKSLRLVELNDAEFEIVLLESLQPLENQKQAIWFGIGIFGGVGGAIASLVGIWIANSISKRVQRLTEATSSLARGEVPPKIKIDGKDEISILARGFNFMSDRVAQRDRQIRFQVEELEATLQELQVTQNQLIEQEKEYSQTLEIKVQQRTQEILAKNKQLQQTLQQLQAAQKQMIAQEKLASLGSLTAGIAHEIRNPLNFINNFAQIAVDLSQELKEEIETQQNSLPPNIFVLIFETINDLETNVTKINSHGKRAAKIVSSMLLHSRDGKGEWQTCNINDLLVESINLAYHGMRAKDISFNAIIETYYDYKIPELTLVSQDINRVFINIINNACYAVNLKKKESSDNKYSPLIRVTSKNCPDKVEVKIWDNGVGIPEEKLERIFEHFFTTKPTGEGTGLGLSLSHEIIVEQHRGRIEVRSEVNKYTEFIINLPKER